jgi:crotonobetainyl-CoA:carnitine CoA-transferase CaiB-like acyl-CoA transferase
VRRERTGRGGHGEVAQAEAVVNMIGDLLLREGALPGSAVAMGNRSERGAPWGCYPCAGVQQWVAITVRDDEDWGRLKLALGNPEWAERPELREVAGRRAAHDELDRRLAEWCSSRTRVDVTSTLQMFRVPVAPMLTGSDQAADPHFQARGYLRWVDQQDLGWICLEGPCFRASGMADVRVSQAPRLGEHTREIGRELLGLADAEIEELVAAGTLEVPK